MGKGSPYPTHADVISVRLGREDRKTSNRTHRGEAIKPHNPFAAQGARANKGYFEIRQCIERNASRCLAHRVRD